MIIKKIWIKNFRNYEQLFLELNPKINIFIGNNAQGKTNLLESIYVLAISKSHRMFIDNNLIKSGEDSAVIRGIIKTEQSIHDEELELFIHKKGKKVSIDKKTVKKISDYISKVNVIIFCPDDLEIIKGSPNIRRKFLNIEIGQLFSKYIVFLNDYNNILKNRNEYLKRINSEKIDEVYLEIVTNQLIDRAIEIYKYRKKFIADLNEVIKESYLNLFGDNQLSVKYETSISLENIESIDLKKELLAKFKSNLNREIIMGQTLIGPHRDDFSFYIDNNDIKNYGSQGQQRMAVLCLKLAEIDLFKKIKEEYPILLLDDIFSELDNTKKNNIIQYIDKGIQTIITTTDINNISKKILKEATVFDVKNGVVTNIEEVKANGRKNATL